MADVVLKICGLDYRVVYATADEVPELATAEGYTSCTRNTIYVKMGMPASRTRDTLVHEVLHAFFEASGVGSFLNDRVRGDYDKFEETLIRLVVQPMLRLVEENGRALISVPAGQKKLLAKTTRARAKKTRSKR